MVAIIEYKIKRGWLIFGCGTHIKISDINYINVDFSTCQYTCKSDEMVVRIAFGGAGPDGIARVAVADVKRNKGPDVMDEFEALSDIIIESNSPTTSSE